jgi:hypothetical protein
MADNGIPEGFTKISQATNCEFFSDAEGQGWIRFDPSARPGGGGGKNPRVATSHGFMGLSVGDDFVRASLNIIV